MGVTAYEVAIYLDGVVITIGPTGHTRHDLTYDPHLAAEAARVGIAQHKG